MTPWEIAQAVLTIAGSGGGLAAWLRYRAERPKLLAEAEDIRRKAEAAIVAERVKQEEAQEARERQLLASIQQEQADFRNALNERIKALNERATYQDKRIDELSNRNAELVEKNAALVAREAVRDEQLDRLAGQVTSYTNDNRKLRDIVASNAEQIRILKETEADCRRMLRELLAMQQDMREVKTNVAEVRSEVQEVKTDVAVVKEATTGESNGS